MQELNRANESNDEQENEDTNRLGDADIFDPEKNIENNFEDEFQVEDRMLVDDNIMDGNISIFHLIAFVVDRIVIIVKYLYMEIISYKISTKILPNSEISKQFHQTISSLSTQIVESK